MKKLATLILTIALILAPAAHADIDLSGMSFNELVELQEKVTAAMWASDEWQEVELPAGMYVIGDDIPAGQWDFSCENGMVMIKVWKSVDEYTQNGDKIWLNVISANAGEKATALFSDGQVIQLFPSSAVFYPHTAAFSFK